MLTAGGQTGSEHSGHGHPILILRLHYFCLLLSDEFVGKMVMQTNFYAIAVDRW